MTRIPLWLTVLTLVSGCVVHTDPHPHRHWWWHRHHPHPHPHADVVQQADGAAIEPASGVAASR